MVIFSGDAYNPALMSTMTKGKQMVPILNALNVQVSCVGNVRRRAPRALSPLATCPAPRCDFLSSLPQHRRPRWALSARSARQHARGPPSLLHSPFLPPRPSALQTTTSKINSNINSKHEFKTRAQHDMDYGVENMVQLNKQCKFPWLMANVLDKKTGQPLGEAGKSVMIKWQGRKVGIVGLVEEEWIATLGTINPEDVTYVDFVTEGRRLARELKEQGAELLIALTHMRVPNDIKLAEEVEEFDIIAGGHDHHVEARRAASLRSLLACR